jgi:hypothetical protein
MPDHEKRAKPKYEAPIVVTLSDLATGSGACSAGSGDTDTCTAGGAAQTACTAGTAATNACTAGSANV